MNNGLAHTIVFLLERACPSIQSRVRREILGQSRNDIRVSGLQNDILADSAVCKILGAQEGNGWLGIGFHGYGGMEACIRLLCEKDLDPANSGFHRAINALKNRTSRFYQGIGKVGDIGDITGIGGIEMIRAALLAQAGEDDEPVVRTQISEALSAFRGITEQENIEEFVKRYKGKLIFRQGVRWPSIYHFRLLAFSQSWRSQENIRMVSDAIAKMVAWSPLPEVHVLYHGQIVASGSFGLHELVPEMTAMDDAGWMMWFQRMELFARLGVVRGIPKLAAQISELEDLLEKGSGKFSKIIQHQYFRKWGAYTGLMLEADWRRAERRVCDLTFRSMLILRMSGFFNI